VRKHLDRVRLRFPLAEFADAVGVAGIKEFNTNAFEGTLVIKDGVGVIGLRKVLRSGRRILTLGHAIGHFLIPNHRFQRNEI
jgi:hypothetical protein